MLYNGFDVLINLFRFVL